MYPPPTERLVFRSWSDEDRALARSLWGDDRVTALIGGPFSETMVDARLALELSNERAYGVQYWPMFLAGGAFVGCCGLKPSGIAPSIYEAGFQLRPDHWGQGFALEALRGVIGHAFGALGATALTAGHHPENDRSRGILVKAGFRHTHHELYPPTGLQHAMYRLDAP